jgi:hypothetical protein
VQSFEFRKEWDHPSLRREVGRSLIVAVKRGLPTVHYYPMLLQQLGMDGPEFGPVEWFYGRKG